MIFLEQGFSEEEYRSLLSLFNEGAITIGEARAFCATGEGGGINNSCSSQEPGTGGDDSASGTAAAATMSGDSAVRAPMIRNVDVMLGGGKSVATIDSEIRQRALEDTRENPKPEGSHPGSATDVWDRTFVRREGDTKTKITTSDPVFPSDRYAMRGSYIAHEDIGQYLSLRHEESRRALGDTVGPTAIIDTTQPLTPDQHEYLVGALTDDVVHAYEVGQFDSGFYSTDLRDAMDKIATIHPEVATDENAKFVFTMLTAITSSGQDPEQNLVDAEALYFMYKRHGTVILAAGQKLGGSDDEEGGAVGGARSVAKSLATFQSMLDSFGLDRTRRLMSGYTTASRLNRTLARLSDMSADPAWREATGSRPWMIDHFSDRTKKGEPKAETNLIGTGEGGEGQSEFRDEVVPMAAIFGPKIGSFYANLSGRHDAVTMDRWLMRSIGRVTGELITRQSPESAKKAATIALSALEVSRSRALLFGVDKPPHRLTKADVVRSLKIQARTGVVEEHGAAYLWARFAERAHKNTPKANGGQYGKHEDPQIHAAHTAGNRIFKSLIYEQQTPRGPQGRRTIREVIREVARRIEERYPERGRVDPDEVQAVLWQYEKNLWKHLGGKVNIKKNSLYSKAADRLVDGTAKRKVLRPEKRSKSRRRVERFDFDDYQFGPEQEYWDSDVEASGIDMLELFLALESDDDEESRAFCPTGENGGLDNSCSAYQGSHKPPSESYGAPAHDLTRMLPDDVYSPDAGRLYGHGDRWLDEQTASIVRSLQGRPDAPVRIYRAVPRSAGDSIHPGDWVTVNPDYAKQHGESALEGDYKVVSRLVTAKDIFTNGDSIHEWGYRPKESRAFCATGAGGGIDNSCSVKDGSLSPETLERHDVPSKWDDSDDEYLYHVTTEAAAEKILESGFRASRATIRGGGKESYSKGKVFFTERSGLRVWEGVVEDHLFDSHDDPPPLAVVRVKKSEVSHLLEDDKRGTKDSGHPAYFIDLKKKKDSRAFCATGDGGGIDNSCGDGGGSSPTGGSSPKGSPDKTYAPDVVADKNEDGVTDAARVGVPAMDVPPPPGIGRLPNLTPHERAVEDAFVSHFEAEPDKVASQFLEVVTKSGDPPTFGTDDAKCLTDAWSDPDPENRAENRATLNTCLHQAANAIAKRAFVDHLDTLQEGDEIMVTVGGCGAGKGFALKHDATALEAKSRAKAVWDSAGDQNATENPWILREAEARGLRVTFVYVHADPKTQWADPDRGVVKRASDPKDGRMVDARVFADSYAIGARNHHAFHQANRDNPNARFIFLDNTGKPKQIDGVPESARNLDADELTDFALREVEKAKVPDRVKKGATVGTRIWGGGRKK